MWGTGDVEIVSYVTVGRNLKDPTAIRGAIVTTHSVVLWPMTILNLSTRRRIGTNINYRTYYFVYIVIGGLGTRGRRRARNSSFRVYGSINFHVFKKMYFKKETQPGFGMLLLSRRGQAPLFVLHSFAHLSCDDHAMHFIILLYTTPDIWTYLYRFIFVPLPSLPFQPSSSLPCLIGIIYLYIILHDRADRSSSRPYRRQRDNFFSYPTRTIISRAYIIIYRYRYTFSLHILWRTRHTGRT